MRWLESPVYDRTSELVSPLIAAEGRDCTVCGKSAIGSMVRSATRGTMHVATGGVTLVGTAAQRKCPICNHKMAKHTGAMGQSNHQVVNVTNVIETPAPAAQPHPTPPPAAPARIDSTSRVITPVEALTQVAELRNAGVLTEAEFAAEKAKILGGPSDTPVASLPPAAPEARADDSAGWKADPAGRHEYRYWTGTAWSDHVSDGGVTSSDPLA